MNSSYESADASATAPARSDTSSASSFSEQELTRHSSEPTTIHAPAPTRPGLQARQSSGTIIVPSTSESAVFETSPDAANARAMSPRRSTEDIQVLGKEAREELRKHAQALQDSLMTIFNRIEAVKEEHDKLDNHNKFLQKYIGDLMATSKITTSSSKAKK